MASDRHGLEQSDQVLPASAFSTGTTASAPLGIGAPVAILMASPMPTVASGRCPIIARPTSLSSAGSAGVAPSTSAARTANPSMPLDANSGRSIAAAMSARDAPVGIGQRQFDRRRSGLIFESTRSRASSSETRPSAES
jgi:hypothetical protein